MTLNSHRIALILRKEWKEIIQQRGLVLSLIFLPIVFTILPLVILYTAGHAPESQIHGMPSSADIARIYPALVGLSAIEQAQAFTGAPLSILILMTPVILPSIIASYSIVGEKVNQTLEPLLATPVTTAELLVAKILASLGPAVVITWFFSLIYIIGMRFAAVSQAVYNFIISPAWFILLLLCAPLLALIDVAATVAISSRATDPRTAQQISAVVILPLMALLLGQFTGALVLSPLVALGLSLLLALLAIVAIWVATRFFQREVILTRWT
ncbi:MAG: ABC transporter permease subunit [Chloroflexia bacterium]